MGNVVFLIRPAPLPGESLSSWRQRVAWANGLPLFPIELGRLQRSDPDLCVDPSELLWISTTYGRPAAELEHMTLRRELGAVVRLIESRRHAPWWLRPKYGAPAAGHGSMYCSACLSEGTPYFRLDWRLAFNTVCPQHQTLYQDTCPHCGHPCWPAACGTRVHLNEGFSSFAECWHCGGRLDRQAGIPEADPVAAMQGDLSLAGFKRIEVLEALRALCQLILRRKPGKLILGLQTGQGSNTALLDQLRSARAVEDLPVVVRNRLLSEAASLLADWPTRFLTRAAQAELRRFHFDAAEDLPEWFEEVVNGPLAKQNRNVRRADILAMADTLRSQGIPVTKAEIRRRLRWYGDIPTEWLKGNLAVLIAILGLASWDTPSATEHQWNQAFTDPARHSTGKTVPDFRPNSERAHRARFRWRTTASSSWTSCPNSRGPRSRRCANRWRAARSPSPGPPGAASSPRASSSSAP